MSEALAPVAGRPEIVRPGTAAVVLPAVIVDAGPAAVERFLEFFAAAIANLRADLERLRGELTRRERDDKARRRQNDRLQRQNDGLQRQNDRLQHRIDHLEQQLAAARRAGHRQAAPFAKDRPQGRGGRPGRRPGAEYGRHGCRPRPARVDETHAAPVPAACPDCGGAVEVTRVASQYQEELPVVRPVVRRFDIEVGHCSQCQRRVQGAQHSRRPVQEQRTRPLAPGRPTGTSTCRSSTATTPPWG